MSMQIQNVVLFGKEMSFKVCSKCKEVKNVDDFYNSIRSSCGKMSQCKSCHDEGTRNWMNSMNSTKSRFSETLNAEKVLNGIDVSRIADDVGRVNMMNSFQYLVSKMDGKNKR
jgi:hypothetical protein